MRSTDTGSWTASACTPTAAARCGCAGGSSARCVPRGERKRLKRSGPRPCGPLPGRFATGDACGEAIPSAPTPFQALGTSLLSRRLRARARPAVEHGARQQRARARRDHRADRQVTAGVGELPRGALRLGDVLRPRVVGVRAGRRARGSGVSGRTRVSGVAGVSGLPRVPRVPGLSRVTGVTRVSRVTGASRVTGVTRVTWVTGVTGVTAAGRIVSVVCGVRSRSRCPSPGCRLPRRSRCCRRR